MLGVSHRTSSCARLLQQHIFKERFPSSCQEDFNKERAAPRESLAFSRALEHFLLSHRHRMLSGITPPLDLSNSQVPSETAEQWLPHRTELNNHSLVLIIFLLWLFLVSLFKAVWLSHLLPGETGAVHLSGILLGPALVLKHCKHTMITHSSSHTSISITAPCAHKATAHHKHKGKLLLLW